MEFSKMTPSLQNILDQSTLKWIFVGGEGGAGKITCSSSLALMLSRYRDNVLIVAYSEYCQLSYVFGQKIMNYPTQVIDVDNLYAMEIGPAECYADDDPGRIDTLLREFPEFVGKIQDFLESVPGYSEIVFFAEVIKVLKNKTFSTVIIVAGTVEQTMRFLHLPNLIENGINKYLNIKPEYMPFVSRIFNVLGFLGISYHEDVIPLVIKLNSQFHNANETTVICICDGSNNCIEETHTFIKDLTESKIDTHNIVVNKVLPSSTIDKDCSMCKTKINLQESLIKKISEIYPEFHVTKLPLLENDIRGTEKISEIGNHLIKPFV